MEESAISRNPVIGLKEHLGREVEIEVSSGAVFKGELRCVDKFNNLILQNATGVTVPSGGAVFVRGTHIITVSV